MLESQAIEWLFKRLIARYGASWHAKWDGVPSVDLKADWGRALTGVTRPQVAHALDHLPVTFPPNAAEFRELCRSAPLPEAAALPPPPKQTPEQHEASKKIRDEALKNLADLKLDASPEKVRATFADFRRRMEAGERLSWAQRDWFRTVAPRFLEPAPMPGDFHPIATEVLPAKMRPDAHVMAPDQDAGP